MEFKHINDCWNYLREAKDIDDLEYRTEELPRWSGDWVVDRDPDDFKKCRVTNYAEDGDIDKEDFYFDITVRMIYDSLDEKPMFIGEYDPMGGMISQEFADEFLETNGDEVVDEYYVSEKHNMLVIRY